MLFVPPSIPFMVPDAFAQTPSTLILDPLPSVAQVGDTVVFSGQLLTADGEFVITGATIYIKDDINFGTDTVYGTLTTDDNGEFYATWNAVQRSGGGSYDFYAVYEGSADVGYARSQSHSVTVTQATTQTAPTDPTPTVLQFGFMPTHTAQEGDTITFSGQLLTADRQYFIPGAQIGIYDNVSLGTDTVIGIATTQDQGIFTLTWKAVPKRSGDYQFYAVFGGTSDYEKARSQEYRLSVTSTAPSAPTPLALILNQVPSTAQEGDTITFSGQLLTADRQYFIPGAQIGIYDNVSLGTDTVIGIATTSDTDGTFTFTWTAVPKRSGMYWNFYAVSVTSSDYVDARSQEYRLSVVQTTPVGPTPTVLDFSRDPPAESVQEGDTITFSGQLLTADRQYFIPGAQIAIKDNVSAATDTQIGIVTTSDTDGTFTFTWTAVPRIYSGDYQFYAETLYDPDYEKARSQEYRLSVVQTTPVGPTPTVLILNQIPSTVQEGDTITFSGQLLTADRQYFISGAQIAIKDNVSLGTDTVIGIATTSDTDGTFTLQIDAVPASSKGGMYWNFYAVFGGSSDHESARSQEYRLSVTPTAPVGPTPTVLQFGFMPTHPAQEGDTITFSGQLLTKDQKYFIPGAQIGIYDNVSLGTDTVIGIATTQDQGIFTLTWKSVPRIYSGDYQFYAVFGGTSDYEKARSQEYRLSVTTIAPITPTIKISTDKASYESGDTIYVSGTITNPIEGKDVTITVTAPSGDVAAVDQITVLSSGTFQTKFIFDRQDTGTYTVTATYTSIATDTLTFKFTKSQVESSFTILVLDPLPSQVKLGDIISLTGKLTNELGEPIAGRTIHLVDGITNEAIFSTTTESDGRFNILWTVGYGDETYSWYVFFKGGNQFESATSKTYSGVTTHVSLYTDLYFQPLPNKIESDQTIEFSGQLSSGGVPLVGKTIYIKDDVALGTDRTIGTVTTDSNGKFAASWTAVPRSDGGSYDFYAIFEGDTGANKARSATYSVYVTFTQVFEQIRVFTFDDEGEESVFEVGDTLRVIGTATPNEELQVALMDLDQNVISHKTIRAGSTGSYDTVLLTWQTSAQLGFGEYTVIVWSQIDERYDYSYVSFIKSESEIYQTKISLNRPPSSVTLNQQITFTGQLQTIDGSPLKGATVGIATISEYTQNPESLTTGITDSSGRFSITWIADRGQGSSTTLPVYAYFVGSQVFEYSTSNSYNITIEKPLLSVYTEKYSYESGESLLVYGYGNPGDRVNLLLKSPNGQTVLSESTIISSDGTYVEYIGTLSSNLSAGTYTVTATSSSFGISDSTEITIKSAAVLETIDIVGDVHYTSASGYVEYPLEGIKTVLTIGANQRVDYTDATGNFEFNDIGFDSQVNYLLHFEVTDGKSFNFVDSQIYDPKNYLYDKNPPIIKSNTMRLLLDNTVAVNQFSLNLNLNMPNRYDESDSRYIFKTFDYQTKVVKFYNKVLNERPPLINVFLFEEGSWYQSTSWNPNTRSVLSDHWQPQIAISEFGGWSAVGMEYTHYTQDYAYQKNYGYDSQPRKDNHAGFANPSTGDSWVEGVGSFMPATIADWYNMSEAGTFSFTDLEDNRYKPNSNYKNYGTDGWLDEELSIATLLWDLYDKRQDGENIVLGINEVWNLIKAYDDFENYNPEYDYKKKYRYHDHFSSDDRHIKYFKDFYEYMSDYDVNHDGRVDSNDQRMVDGIFALHGISNGLTDPNRSDRV